MIALFLTFMISIFCCSSFNSNGLNVSNVYRDFNEIEIREDINTKNVVYGSDSLVMSYSDLCSPDTAYYFISSLINEGYTALQATNTYTYSFTIPCDGRFIDLWNYNFNTYEQCVSLTIGKDSHSEIVVDNTTFYRNRYNLQFNLSNGNNFKLIWWISAFWDFVRPLVFSGFIEQNGEFETQGNIGYVEDTSYGSNLPFTQYFLPSYKDYNNLPSTAVYSQGYDEGYKVGNSNGYQSGYNQGLIDGSSYDDTALTIFTGILEVGLLPVNVFLQILNFEVFGINIAGFVSALLTVSIVIIIIRFVLGRKDD